jgi:hypothetical protein
MKPTKLAVAVVLALAAPIGQAQEVGIFYGKGTSNNPNADMSLYSLAYHSGALAGMPARTVLFTGEVFGDASQGRGARPFKFLGVGKDLTIGKGVITCTIGGGVYASSRTVDTTEYGLSTYTSAACGMTIRGVQIAVGRFQGQAPGLKDPWGNGKYDAPVFQGLRVSVDLDIRRTR